MTTPCAIVAEIDQAISDILTTGAIQKGRQGALDYSKYDLDQLKDLRATYASLCAQESSPANNGGLIMSKITNVEPS